MSSSPGEYGVRLGALTAIAAIHVAVGLVLLAVQVVPRVQVDPPPLMARLVPESTRVVPEQVPIPRPRIVEQMPLATVPMPEITLEAARSHEAIRAPAAPPAPSAPSAARTETVAESPVEPPRADLAYLDNPAPRYPSLSRRLGEQGRVMLRVRVNASGQVEAIELRSSSGFERLDAAAIEAVKQWRFVPARRGREALAGWALVPIDFHLKGARAAS